MKILISTLAALALAVAGGCSTRNENRAAARDVKAMTDEELAEASIAFMAELVEAGKRHEGDCEPMAKAMMRVVEANEDLVSVTRTYRRDPAKSRWFEERYGKRVEPMGMWLAGALTQCGDSPAMRELMDSMN